MTSSDNTEKPTTDLSDPDQRWRPTTEALAQRTGGDMVVVHLGTDEIYELNTTGARIWELVTEGRSRQEIEQQLAREYEVEAGQLRNELDELVASLERARLLSPVVHG